MRKIKNNVMMVLALLPLAVYLLVVFRVGSAPAFLSTMQTALGDFGAFFADIITPVLTSLVPLANTDGVAVFTWIIGYYVTLIFVSLIFELFTFLITLISDKFDTIKTGGK